jgi:hypothetical protein
LKRLINKWYYKGLKFLLTRKRKNPLKKLLWRREEDCSRTIGKLGNAYGGKNERKHAE